MALERELRLMLIIVSVKGFGGFFINKLEDNKLMAWLAMCCDVWLGLPA